jgi:hypothetical protein
MEMPRRAPQLHTHVHFWSGAGAFVSVVFARAFSRGFTRGFVEVVLIRGLVFLA